VLVQGLGLRTATRVLGVAGAARALRVADLDATTLQTLGADVVELDIYPGGVFEGQAIKDLPLQGAVVVAVRRGDAIVLPRGDTVLQRDDRVYLLLDRNRVAALEATIMSRERRAPVVP
jgi:cell volume regulation protein A